MKKAICFAIEMLCWTAVGIFVAQDLGVPWYPGAAFGAGFVMLVDAIRNRE